MSKNFNAMTERERSKAMGEVKIIEEGKFGDSIPEMKKRITALGGFVRSAFEALAEVREEMGSMKKDVTELKELKPIVEGMGSQITELGKQMTGLGSNIDNLQKSMNEKHEKVDKVMNVCTEALDGIKVKLEEDSEDRGKEREERERERQQREEEKLAIDRNLVAPNLILYGLNQDTGENPAALRNKLGDIFYNILGLGREEIIIEKVIRFGKRGEAAASAAARPSRPALVRVVLAEPYMKGPLFKSLINLKGKDEYRGLSIQNEVPRSQMEEHKAAVERAKSIRIDTNCRTRIKFSKGPVTLQILYDGKWMNEDEFSEKWNTGNGNGNWADASAKAAK